MEDKVASRSLGELVGDEDTLTFQTKIQKIHRSLFSGGNEMECKF